MDALAKTAPAARSVRQQIGVEKIGTFALPVRPALKVARKRLEKFVSLPPRLLVNDHPERIHDLRVSSRRLQQILSLLAGTLSRGKCRRLIRKLRRLRSDFSVCRSLDVTANLLENEIASSSSGTADAWKALHKRAVKLRARQFASARKRLRRFDVPGFASKGAQLLKAPETQEIDTSAVRDKVAASQRDWLELVERAKSTRRAEDLHQLRLAGKRLRYRLELLAALGHDGAKTRTRSLKNLQDQLGRWHDGYILVRFAQECLETRSFGRGRANRAHSLQGEIERLKRDNDAAVDRLIEEAEKFQRTGLIR